MDRTASTMGRLDYWKWLDDLRLGQEVQMYWTAGSFGHFKGRARLVRVNPKSVAGELLEEVGGPDAYPEGRVIVLPKWPMDRRFSEFLNAPVPVGVDRIAPQQASSRTAADVPDKRDVKLYMYQPAGGFFFERRPDGLYLTLYKAGDAHRAFSPQFWDRFDAQEVPGAPGSLTYRVTRKGAVASRTAGEKVFDEATAEEWRVRLNRGIRAPVVGTRISRLGGPENVALLPTVSLDRREDWPNGILENSRYFHIDLSNDGTMEMFSGHVRPAKPLRKTRVRTVEEAIEKLNRYVEYVEAETAGVRTASDGSGLRARVEDKEAELNARLAEASRHVFRALSADAAEAEVGAAMRELEALERAVKAVEDGLL